MWKNMENEIVKATVNGWTLFVHTDERNGQYWTRTAYRQWLVRTENYPSVEAAKAGLEEWANTHRYAGKGKIEKVS